MSYAEGTTVTVEKSKAELEAVVRRHGGYNFGSASLDAEGVAIAYFSIGQGPAMRQVRLRLALPKVTAFKPRLGKHARTAEQLWEQACRERWRLLVLAVKAKLELIAAGAGTVDGEFLASIALPDGKTVLELLVGAVGAAYTTGKMPQLITGSTVVEGELDT